MEVVQMKYYPKEVYYENRHGVNYIILDYGDSKVERVIAAQQSVQSTLLESSRHGSHSCECGLCKGSHTTLPQSG